MNDLEAALRELDVEWPATPDLATAVAGRIAVEARGTVPAPGAEAPRGGQAAPDGAAARGRTRRLRLPPLRGWRTRRLRLPPLRGWRTRLAYLAAGFVLLAGGTLAASPQARSDVLRWLGLKSVEIKREAPRPVVGGALDLGPRLARVLRGTRIPKALGAPGTAYDTTLPDGTHAVSLVYADPAILVQVFRARATPFIEKTVGQGAEVEPVEGGYWITGAHGFAYESDLGFGYERQRLADRTLLIERDGLLVRVEGAITKDRAVEIARSLF